MTKPHADPRLERLGQELGPSAFVHLVANGVRGDSRVIKAAQVSASAGFPTVIVGVTLEEEPQAFEYGGIPVILMPFRTEPTADDLALVRSWSRALTARRFERAVLRRGSARRIRTGLGEGRGGVPEWAAPRPMSVSYNAAFLRALDALRPAAIHCHDVQPLPASVMYSSSEHFRRHGVRVMYDAHECVPEMAALHRGDDRYAVLESMESTFIRDAQQVLTVSSPIATLLRDTYHLRRRPLVVTNAPSGRRDPTAPDLRTEIGLAPGVPLAVYSGWVAAERGLATSVRALTLVPELHLAIVSNSNSGTLRATITLARELGVIDRLHVTSYVPPEQVTQFLSSADIGLIPLKRGRHLDLSLPTKYREYLHAGLPLVVSNHKTMAREVRRTGVGVAFRAGRIGALAEALSTVLEDPAQYRAAITPELLETHSWETQAQRLRTAYTRTGVDADPDAEARQSAGVKELRSGFEQVELLDDASTWRRRVDPKRATLSLGVGRANSAGQAFAWANVATEVLQMPAESFAPPRALTAGPHVEVPARERLEIHAAALELERVLSSYTHVLVDGYERLFGTLIGDDIGPELVLLKRHGIEVGLVAHGSDVRDPDRHMADLRHSYFFSADAEWTDLMRRISERNREIAQFSGLPLFVSTPDLLDDLPSARWLPVVVDGARWEEQPAIRTTGRLRVLHRPSRSEPPIKGSDVVVPILERLADEGVVEYHDGGGDVVPNADMPALVGSVDVVVDQIRTGSYGVAAVEAMAAGRIVVGGATEHVRSHTRGELPIVDADPATFEAVIRDLAALSGEARRELGERGRTYARAWHDGRLSGEVLASFVDGS